MMNPVEEVKRTPRARRSAWAVIGNTFGFLFKNQKSIVGVCIFLVFLILAVFAPLIAPYDPSATIFDMSSPPSAAHIMGTTSTGQDVFSQFVYGARTTLAIGIGAGVFSTIIALAVGMTAGYVRGITDSILNLISNIFLVLPGLALLIVIESLVRNSTPLINGIIITATGWAWGARVFRAQTMSLSNRDFVVAARLSGASPLRIMATEIAPNMVSVIAANVMYASLGAILAESGLAFLGLEDVQSFSWGTMLYWASQNSALLTGAWWWIVPPGLAIALVGLSLVLMNFAIDQVTNPRLRQETRRKRHGRKRASA